MCTAYRAISSSFLFAKRCEQRRPFFRGHIDKYLENSRKVLARIGRGLVAYRDFEEFYAVHSQPCSQGIKFLDADIFGLARHNIEDVGISYPAATLSGYLCNWYPGFLSPYFYYTAQELP